METTVCSHGKVCGFGRKEAYWIQSYEKDLWRSHRCLQDVEGFDHSVVNSTLGACGGLPPGQENPTLPFSIWQCGESKKMSDIVTIMEFNFLEPISPCSGKAKVEFIAHGKCHGLVLWIDWVMDTDESIVLSTGPGSGGCGEP